MKLCMIAGERSGDLHGSTVASLIKRAVPDAELFGMGGERMKNAGVEIIHDMTEMAVVGFIEVLRNFRTFRAIFHHLLRVVEERKPDAVVLIDLPGFNLRFGPRVKQLGIPVIYYISPQTWAWGKGRTKKMGQFIDRFFVILPFEVEFYQKEKIKAEFVGHPLVDVISTQYTRDKYREILGIGSEEKLVALLPGSREHEMERMLPLMVLAAKKIRESIREARFVVPAASDNLRGMAREILHGSDVEIDVRVGGGYDIMNASDAAVVSSGTATLEVGWFGVPFVLVYRMSFISYLIAKCLANVDMIGLLNILMDKEVAPEFIQQKATPQNVAGEIIHYLKDEKAAQKKRDELLRIREILGHGGAAKRVANGIIEFVMSNKS